MSDHSVAQAETGINSHTADCADMMIVVVDNAPVTLSRRSVQTFAEMFARYLGTPEAAIVEVDSYHRQGIDYPEPEIQ